MNRLTKTAVMAGAMALLAQGAYAQLNPGDLLLGFTLQNGNPSGNDYVIDLGSSFLSNPGTTDLTVSSGFSLSTFQATFGSGVTGVNAGVVGGNNTGGNGTAVWTTLLRTGSPADATTPGTETAPVKINLAGNLTGAAGVANAVATGTPAQNASGLNSWSQQIAKDPTTAGANLHNFVSYTGSSANPLSSFTSSGILVEDLWTESRANNANSSFTYDGYFTINLSGSTPDITFTSSTLAAVPEPGTYGLLAGAGLLALSLRRQLSRSNA